MVTRFVVHLHKTGKPHYDLRIVWGDVVRSWSILREPPVGTAVDRLAIERESLPADALDRNTCEEAAFGAGQVLVWDKGQVEVAEESSQDMSLRFMGARLTGTYLLRRMRWYPGNRWLLKKEPQTSFRSPAPSALR